MRYLVLLALIGGCNNTECASGTIMRGGKCEPADLTAGAAMCGPFTMLEGTTCVPQFPPTICDPATTMPNTDPTTGVTTCIGTGGGGCSATLACPTPSGSSKQTVCGQLYDIATNQPFAATGATGAKCTTATTTGPCSLGINAYDAFAFAMNPQTAQPLANGGVYIDDCGRYRVTDIVTPGGPFIGLGIDDSNMANLGPGGNTNTTGVALPKAGGTATPNVEAWIAAKATTDMWTSTGGPDLATAGMYVAIFRAHVAGMGDQLAPQAGVTITKSGVTEPTDDYYFVASETGHLNIDPTATATGANGTGLLTNASVNDNLVYSGQGGIADMTNCQWPSLAAASLPEIVFFQVYRKQNKIGHTCTE